MKCACCEYETNIIGSIRMRDFDLSIFNMVGVCHLCPNCGFVRIETKLNDEDIVRHYSEFSLYSTLSGVGVGGSSTEDNKRYEHYASVLIKHGLTKGRLADIGCSKGGFIQYMSHKEPEIDCIGIDCDLKSLEFLKDSGCDVLEGSVFSLPLARAEIDTLTYFHVLEHIYDIDQVVIEASRVLKDNGTLIVEVPDAERYFEEKNYVGPMFWLGMKEHVNHFTCSSLVRFLKKAGFNIQDVIRANLPMKGEKNYPSLLLVAKKKSDTSILVQQFSKTFECNFINEIEKIKRFSSKLAEHCDIETINFWGIGLEFFTVYAYLSPMIDIKNIRLMDNNIIKQKGFVDGIVIENPSIVSKTGILLCCSYMVEKDIKKEALCLGWTNEKIWGLFEF